MVPDGSVDIIHEGTTGYGFGSGSDEARRYQIFVAPPNCTAITDLWVKLRRTAGADFASPIVELYATTNNQPAGIPLARGYLNSGVGSAFGLDWGPLNFKGLVPGTTYAIVLSAETFSDQALNPAMSGLCHTCMTVGDLENGTGPVGLTSPASAMAGYN